MSFIARLIAGARALSVDGPLGTLLEHAAAHVPHWHLHWPGHAEQARDAADPRRRIAFTIAVIALGAKMAKADGTVTDAEITAFREVFQVPEGEEEHVRLVFDLSRKSTAGFEVYARQVGRMFAGDPAVLEDLLGGLFHIALADATLRPAEDAYLREVARLFGFDAAGYARIRALHAGDDDSNPYVVLGIAPGAPVDEIRLAYHRLLRESHPDVLIGRGLPPECVKLATARAARINAAYALVAGHRPLPA